jgi:hypothetical protein
MPSLLMLLSLGSSVLVSGNEMAFDLVKRLKFRDFADIHIHIFALVPKVRIYIAHLHLREIA